MRNVALLVCSLLAVPSAAAADSFSATFVRTGLGAGVTAYNGSQKFEVFAGQIGWDANGVDDFLSYCLQLDSALRTTQDFTVAPTLVDSPKREAITDLVTGYWTQVTTNWMAAGFQLAIWNILYEGDASASQGTFYSSTGAATYWADQFLGGLNRSTSGHAVFLDSTPGTRGQDQVTYSTPEPGTLLLLGAGLAALATRRRMRRAN